MDDDAAPEVVADAAFAKLRAEHAHLQGTVKGLEDRLAEEKASAQDRKKKIKSYVESLDAEKAQLEQTIASLKAALKASEADGLSAAAQQQRAADEAVARERATAAAGAAQQSGEAARLQQDLAAARASVAVLEESAKALELHKSKRLTAKFEMVALARILESERDVSNQLEKRIREVIAPKCAGHGAAVQACLDRVDDMAARVCNDARSREGQQASRAAASPLHDAPPATDARGKALDAVDQESDRIAFRLQLLGHSIESLDFEIARYKGKSFFAKMCATMSPQRAAPAPVQPGVTLSYSKIDHLRDEDSQDL